MFSFRKKTLPPLSLPDASIRIEKQGKIDIISAHEFSEMTGALFIPQIDFGDFNTLLDIKKKTEKLHRKGELSREQIWLGSYYRKELTHITLPDVFIRYIDPEIGWGVFASRNLKKMTFIAEYSGKIRKRRRSDSENAYCFEYLPAEGAKSSYVIDALDQGGISRYINHSEKPNLISTLATLDGISHIILVVKEPIPKGTQLCYDYGSAYWANRPKPQVIPFAENKFTS